MILPNKEKANVYTNTRPLIHHVDRSGEKVGTVGISAALPLSTTSAEAAEQTGADTTASSSVVAATAASLAESSDADEGKSAAAGSKPARSGLIAVGAVAAAMAALW